MKSVIPQKQIKGGVIIIGSLRWENKKNSNDKVLAEKREQWRTENLDIEKEEPIKLPIRYGRSSSTRKCTYTMVFSSTVLDNLGQGLIVPYQESIDFNNYLNFERQALKLAEVEGISQNDSRLRKVWSCIGIYINPESDNRSTIENYWQAVRLLDSEYKKNSQSYIIEPKEESLLTKDYMLNDKMKVQTKLDFLFFTYIKPEHRNQEAGRYPTSKEIAEEIIKSGYKTYFQENKKHKITTKDDIAIDKLINKNGK